VNEPVIPSPPARRFRPTPALIAGGLVAGFFLAGLGVAFAQTSSSGTTPTIPVSPVPPPAGQIVPAPAPAQGPAQGPGPGLGRDGIGTVKTGDTVQVAGVVDGGKAQAAAILDSTQLGKLGDHWGFPKHK